MPYNPQITYTGDRSMMEGKSTLVSVLASVFGGLAKNAEEADQLRSYLTKADPEHYDPAALKQMSLGTLKGAAQAYQTNQERQAKQVMLQHMLGQIAEQNQRNDAEKAMSLSFAQSQPAPVTNSVPMSPEVPPVAPFAAGTPTTNLAPVTFQTPGQFQPGALIEAMGRNSDSINSRAGGQILRDFSKSAEKGIKPGQTMVPFDKGGLSGLIEVNTGKTFLDVDTTRRLAEAKMGPGASKKAGLDKYPADAVLEPANDAKGNAIPGLFNVKDKTSGAPLGRWQNPAHAAAKGNSLLFPDSPPGGAPAAPAYKTQADVVKAYKAGTLTYEQAGQILQSLGAAQ